MRILFLLIIFFLSGCTNAFKEYYEGLSRSEIIQLNEEHHFFDPNKPIDTKLIIGNMRNIVADRNAMLSNNYILLGTSSFNGGSIDNNLALYHGQELIADMVILYYQHTDTISTMMPLTLPDISTANTTIYDSYYNNIGTANTTIYGQSTTYIPTIINRYDYLATYWKKSIRKPRVGIQVEDLTDEMKMQIQSNSGVYIDIIMNNSPAFYSNLLRGDIIYSINNQRIINIEHYYQYIKARKKGEKLNLVLIRNGKAISKSLIVN